MSKRKRARADAEYEAYLASLYDVYIARRVGQAHAGGRHFPGEDYEYHLAQLASRDVAVRAIAAGMPPYSLRSRAIGELFRVAANNVEFNNRVLDESGFADVLDGEAGRIAKRMRVEHLPAGEVEMLRQLGFALTGDDVAALMHIARDELLRRRQQFEEIPISAELRALPQRLQRIAQEHERDLEQLDARITQLETAQADQQDDRAIREQSAGALRSAREERERRQRPRRTFKGLGQILQGTAMSVADVALAAGALRFKVTDETKSWGALVSVTVGVGTLLSGVGDLRGE